MLVVIGVPSGSDDLEIATEPLPPHPIERVMHKRIQHEGNRRRLGNSACVVSMTVTVFVRSITVTDLCRAMR